MNKRKREGGLRNNNTEDQPRKAFKSASETDTIPLANNSESVIVQIVTGSYERVLHGFTANLSKNVLEEGEPPSGVQFSDTFLFEAHKSAIRCLALSPANRVENARTQRLILASGGTDERINLYELSMTPPIVNDQFPSVSTFAGNHVLENPRNRELGSLLHHSSAITALYFPSRSKLLAAAEDNTISVTKTRDWTVISTIKAPHPKVQGRPSGDAAPSGTSPSGISNFAIHPSMKLMLSVGRGEKCMRLWNLVTGKKAGVLNFRRDLLQSVGEGKWSLGEGRHIIWDSQGEEFAVAFERGVIVFGTDSKPKYRVIPTPATKIHRIRYFQIKSGKHKSAKLLAVSTEDGRIVFYSGDSTESIGSEDSSISIPKVSARAEVGGKLFGISGRVKDFELFSLAEQPSHKDIILIVACGSDGAVRVWSLNIGAFAFETKLSTAISSPPRVGKLLGTYETGNRITCMVAFIMQNPQDESLTSDFEAERDEEDGVDGSGTDETDD